jgi:hypothetical protein
VRIGAASLWHRRWPRMKKSGVHRLNVFWACAMRTLTRADLDAAPSNEIGHQRLFQLNDALRHACRHHGLHRSNAARPDGILRVARSPRPSSTPLARDCLRPGRCRTWSSIESSVMRSTTLTERVWFLRLFDDTAARFGRTVTQCSSFRSASFDSFNVPINRIKSGIRIC